ncbi:glycosyl hydrolases family protein [Streptococcus pseudoporcinus]|nr:glycosyl hydrolases family protein [Streptococcus pseudoporcinus]
MRAEAQAFYKNASPFNPTYYWIDVEEATMKDMNKGVKAFREELKRLGAENVGLYIGTYFMAEQNISTEGLMLFGFQHMVVIQATMRPLLTQN